MAELENHRHEKFCQLRARGVKQGDSYIQAGFVKNPGAASRLASSKVIVARIQEIEEGVRKSISTEVSTLGDIETAIETLADMGIDMPWIAHSYQKIYKEALQAGSFAAANSAVSNLQKMVEIEQNGAPEIIVADDDKISVKDTLQMLNVMADMVKTGQAANDDPEPEMRDITPTAVLQELNQ